MGHFYFKINPRLCSKDLQNACGPRRRFEYSQINRQNRQDWRRRSRNGITETTCQNGNEPADFDTNQNWFQMKIPKKEIIRQVRQNQTKWILLPNRQNLLPMSISMELMCMMVQFWNKTRKYEKETATRNQFQRKILMEF